MGPRTASTMTQRVAVIGAGAAGISAAYHLRDEARLTLLDANAHAGGHANTVAVEEADRELGIDTAFVVFNARTYPQLTAFFEELGVEALDHEGGFNFFDLDSGLQYGSAELELDEMEVAQRYPTAFVDVWRQAQRFYEESPRDFIRGRADLPLGEYLDRNGYTDEFKRSYVVLLATAVWSVPAELIWEMPASTFIAFFMSHDPGGLGGHTVAWKTVADGSRSYVRRALDAIGGEVRLNTEVLRVREAPDGVEVVTRDGAERFDFAIVATHADEALELLEQPTDEQRAVLEKVRYSQTHAVLHRDASVLPPDRTRWQSWNYGRVRAGGEPRTYVAYWMNRLQGLDATHDYFVTLDFPLPLDEDSIVCEIPYAHPVISMDARRMQRGIYRINDGSRIKLCGSYFHAKRIGPDLVGSHEAAFCSGAEAARSVRRALREPAVARS